MEGGNTRAFQILDRWRSNLKAAYRDTSDDSYITRGGIREAMHGLERISDVIVKGGRLPKEGLLRHCYGPGSDWSDHAVARDASSYLSRAVNDLKAAGYDLEPKTNVAAWFPESTRPQDIRKTVWGSAWTDHVENEKIGAAVGLTKDGKFRIAEALMTEEPGARNVSWRWNRETHELKEHAIYAARESIAKTLRAEQQTPEPTVALTGKSAAMKYGGNDAPGRSITPPSRSR